MILHALTLTGEEYVPIASNGFWMGQVLPDYDTVWYMQNDAGQWVTIKNSSRGRRNEILNGAVLGSSYKLSPGLPATERFSSGNSVMLTKTICQGLSLANWTISQRYISWELFKAEILRATRSAGFWSNTVSSSSFRFEFHNGDSNGIETFGILVQPMTMSASIVKLLDRSGDEYVIEAIGAEQVNVNSPFIDIHQYQHLWSITSNSVRKEILDAKGNRLGFEEHYCEPLLSGNIRIPTLGTFRTSLAETGWAARLPAFRVREYIGDAPYPWVMREGSMPPSPFGD